MPDSRYAIQNVKWSFATALEPGPAELAVDPECVVLCVPATAYEELYEITCELVQYVEWCSDPAAEEFTFMPDEIDGHGIAALAKFRASVSGDTP